MAKATLKLLSVALCFSAAGAAVLTLDAAEGTKVITVDNAAGFEAYGTVVLTAKVVAAAATAAPTVAPTEAPAAIEADPSPASGDGPAKTVARRLATPPLAGIKIERVDGNVVILATPLTQLLPKGSTAVATPLQPLDSSAFSSGSSKSLHSVNSNSLHGMSSSVNSGSDSFTSGSSGSKASGSWGSFLEFWQWFVVAILLLICCIGAGVFGKGKKPKKKKSKKAVPAPAPEPVIEAVVPELAPLMVPSYNLAPMQYAAPVTTSYIAQQPTYAMQQPTYAMPAAYATTAYAQY